MQNFINMETMEPLATNETWDTSLLLYGEDVSDVIVSAAGASYFKHLIFHLIWIKQIDATRFKTTGKID